MSNIKYIPILFKPEMVNAILEGRKTQTRREVKSPQTLSVIDVFGKEETKTLCPYGQPGDILFVRETFFEFGRWVENGTTKTGKTKYKFEDCTIKAGFNHQYLDTTPASFLKSRPADRWSVPTWYKRNSLFMPKAACRIFLEIIEVRVQRLKDINDKDALAEGIEFYYSEMFKENRYKDYCPISKIQYQHAPKGWTGEWREATSSFLSLWDRINGKNAQRANPFVWAITFKRIDKPANWPNHA